VRAFPLYQRCFHATGEEVVCIVVGQDPGTFDLESRLFLLVGRIEVVHTAAVSDLLIGERALFALDGWNVLHEKSRTLRDSLRSTSISSGYP
jgi:hypothetical protein